MDIARPAWTPWLAGSGPGPGQRWLGWWALALDALAVGLCCVLLWHARLDQLHDAERQTLYQARLIERSTTALLERAAVALSTVTHGLELQLADGGIDRARIWGAGDEASGRSPLVQRFGIFDAEGRQVCVPAGQPCPDIRIADRDYFKAARSRTDGAVSLWGPHGSRFDGRTSLMLTRTLRDGSGGFAGVVVAPVPLDQLASLLRAAEIGQHGSATLRAGNLDLLVREPALALPEAGTPGPKAAVEMHSAVATAPEEGVYRAISTFDGAERVTAYHRSSRFGLYVTVGQASADFLAHWRQLAAWSAACLALLAVATLALAWSVTVGQRRQRQLHQLFDQAPCGRHALDAQGRYVVVNATELAWLGQRREDVVGRCGPGDFFGEADRVAFDARLRALALGDRLDGFEADLHGRDGGLRRVLISATAVRDRLGRFLASNSVAHDITALHRSQQELQALWRAQALLLDTELVGIAKASQGRIVWANRGLERMLGDPREGSPGLLSGRLHALGASGEDLARQAQAWLGGGGSYRVQTRLQRSDGRPLWVDVSGERLGPDGDEMLLVVADISALKAAEEDRVHAAQLEARNAQLREAGRSKDQLLANLSHELRTPLNAVIGYAHLLQSDRARADPARFAAYAQQIGASGRQLLQLIETMLDYAKAEGGEVELLPQPTNVFALLHDVAGELRAPAGRARQHIAIEAGPALPEVEIDPVRLRQVLLQLLGNALKFSAPGSAVTLRAGSDGADHWYTEVEDQGIGIAAADLERIFLPFVQLSAGSARTHGGIGLGLTLVQRLVALQGGRIDVSSTPGIGTRVRVTLPLQRTGPVSGG